MLSRPLTIEALLSTGVASTSQIRHVAQGTATSAAAGVGEGEEKPESTLGFGVVDEPVKKTATVITLSDEILDDAPSIQTFVNSELTRFVNIEVERQLLRGTAGGNEVVGLLNRGFPVYTAATATDGAMPEQLFRAINSVRGSAYIEPEWVVMNPTDYQTIRLAEDSNGQLYGGGPFVGPYGNGGQANASGQVTGATETIWGKPVHVTSALGVGTALIGQSQAARVWNRGGLQIELSNSHASLPVRPGDDPSRAPARTHRVQDGGILRTAIRKLSLWSRPPRPVSKRVRARLGKSASGPAPRKRGE